MWMWQFYWLSKEKPQKQNADVAKLVDALDLGSSAFTGVGVRLPSSAQTTLGFDTPIAIGTRLRVFYLLY